VYINVQSNRHLAPADPEAEGSQPCLAVIAVAAGLIAHEDFVGAAIPRREYVISTIPRANTPLAAYLISTVPPMLQLGQLLLPLAVRRNSLSSSTAPAFANLSGIRTTVRIAQLKGTIPHPGPRRYPGAEIFNHFRPDLRNYSSSQPN